jgi:hypothetical protein
LTPEGVQPQGCRGEPPLMDRVLGPLDDLRRDAMVDAAARFERR